MFDRIKKEMRIRTAKTFDGQFNCMRCAALDDSEEEHNCVELERQTEQARAAGTLDDNLELKVSLDASQQRVKQLHDHRALREHQFAYLMQCRHNTIEEERGRMLVVMDFSKYFYKRNVTMEALTKKDRQEYIHDMVLVFESWPRSASASEPEEEEMKAAAPPIEGKEEKKRGASLRRMRGRGREKVVRTLPRRWVRYVDNLCEHAGVEGNDTPVPICARRVSPSHRAEDVRRVRACRPIQ